MCKIGYHIELTDEEGNTADGLIQDNMVQLVYELALQPWHTDNVFLLPKDFCQAALCFTLSNYSTQNAHFSATNMLALDTLQTSKQEQSTRINKKAQYIVLYVYIFKV